MSSNIFTYWEGKVPPWIGLCLETLRYHNPDIVILTPDVIDWGGIDVSHLTPSLRSDLVRVSFLRRFGGMWVDADCIAMRPFDPLFSFSGDLVCYHDGLKIDANWFISQRGGSIIGEWWSLQLKIFKNGAIGHTDLGAKILTLLSREREIKLVPTYNIMPIHWRDGHLFWETDIEIDSRAYMYMLTRGVMGHRKWWKRDRILHSESLISRLFRMSLRL